MLTPAPVLSGGHFTLLVLKIDDPYDPALSRALEEQAKLHPDFFAGAPVVADLQGSLSCTSVADYTALRQLLRRHGLVLVGVQNASSLQLRAAKAVDLSPFPPSAARRPAAEAARSPATVPPAPSRPAAAATAASAPVRRRLFTEPVRSGTQIYVRDGDLVVTAPVSPGAELIADGCIHVYGALRGRAIAGASGDEAARIFTHRLDAELVSIAGRYLTAEDIPPEHVGLPAQVALGEDGLVFIGAAGAPRGEARRGAEA